MGVVYAEDQRDIRPVLRSKIIEKAEEDGPKKPWTIVHLVTEEPDFSEEETRKALKEMMLSGELEIASTGEVRAKSRPA